MLHARPATLGDVPLLARLNHQLIRDEGHRNPMTVEQLAARMRAWLETEYAAVVFEQDGGVVAYALWRDDGDEAYIRHFFVARDHRHQGIGRQAVRLLLDDILPRGRCVVLDVLAHNSCASAFWQSLGFTAYAVTMELPPPTSDKDTP